MTNRVVLHIDRLVLRGVDPGDAAAVADALRAELATLLTPDAGAAMAAQGSAAVRRAGPVTLAPGTDAAGLGHAVAGRIAGQAVPRAGGAP